MYYRYSDYRIDLRIPAMAETSKSLARTGRWLMVERRKNQSLLAMILLLVVANGAASAWNDKSEKKKEKEAEASRYI